MIVAGWLFIILSAFGVSAGTVYWATNAHPELAGVGLLYTFCIACAFLGYVLLRHAPGRGRFKALPDTGLHGSANPERGAADEHGNIHLMAPTNAPAIYSLACALLLGGFAFRAQGWGVPTMVAGLVLFVTGTALWYRNVSADTRAALAGGHGGAHTEGHAVGTLPVEVPSAGPPGPANWFEQLRQAVEAGDANWAADAYAAEAVYYEPANPPHEGRESIRAYLNDFLKGHRDATWRVQRMGVDGDKAIVEWSLSFRTRLGQRVADQPGVTVIETGAGGITYHRDYL
jgi:hypothetical protein